MACNPQCCQACSLLSQPYLTLNMTHPFSKSQTVVAPVSAEPYCCCWLPLWRRQPVHHKGHRQQSGYGELVPLALQMP